MQKKLLSVLFCTLLIATVILPVSGTSEIDMSQDGGSKGVHGNFLGSDALTPPDISNIKNTPCFGLDPGFYETSEYVMNNRPISEVWTEQVREKAVKNLEKEKKDMSILHYGQEYLGLFMEDLMRYFSDEFIDKVCTEKKPETISQYKDYYLGVDIARLGDDETTFEIIKRVNKENLIHVHHEIARKRLTTQTEDRIIQLNNQYHTIKKIYIDAGAGSLGVGVLDHLLRNEQTKRKVEAINNRKLVLDREGKTKQRLLKEDLYDNLKSLGEKGQIHLLDDEKVRASLRSIQYEFIKKANQATQMRIFGNYSHIVEGLIRAAWCNKEKQINRLIYSFKP